MLRFLAPARFLRRESKRAEQLKSNPDAVAEDIKQRVKLEIRQSKGDFSGVHDLPASSSDVPDDSDARLVILGVEYPYTKDANSPAIGAAKAILDTRGSSPRLLKTRSPFSLPTKQSSPISMRRCALSVPTWK